jgi:periplasmic protein TonB
MSAGIADALLASHWNWRRLAFALGASLLAHYLIVAVWPSSGGGRPMPMVPLLKAQLEITAAALTVPSAESADLSQATVLPASTPLVPARLERTESPAVAPEVQFSGAQASAIPDSRFYSARELDRFPEPVAPLELQSVTGRSGSVRLRIGIDLAGRVVEIDVVDSDPSGALEAYAREQLQATRFMPGLKDGRPVRSRILLELRYGQ